LSGVRGSRSLAVGHWSSALRYLLLPVGRWFVDRVGRFRRSLAWFDQPEVMVPFKCDGHPWMSAYAGIVPHPFYAVSAADGTFEIPRLPAGTYTLEVWHEELGVRTAEVTVDGSGDAESPLPSRRRPAGPPR
jgi:hypothetical protein